jgi:hypothetical protein
MSALLTHEGTQARTTEQAASTGRGRLRRAWRRIRLTVQEMNYGTRRVVEVQAPWTADKQWHRK